MKNSILVLPSWYPSKLDKFDGDFVQRHVQAISLFCKQYVIYVVKDKEGIITTDYKIEKSETDTITEIIVYYKSFKTGISFVDKLVSQKKYTSLYKKVINEYINTFGVPQLTHLHIAYKAGILAMWVKRKWKVPYVLTEHWTGYHKNALPNIFTNNRLRFLLTKNIFKLASHLFPVSKNLGQAIVQNFYTLRYTQIYNAVNTNFFKYKNYQQSIFTFSHISKMVFQKNVEGIIEACEILKNRGVEFKLNLIGNKPKHLIELAAQKKLLNNYVFFEDSMAYEKVAEVLQHSNALVMNSRFENLPCVILESLCCGTPVISTTVGGIAEVIDTSNGILINENIDELTAAMENMIHNYAKYDRHGIAQNSVNKFSYETVGKQYVDLYNTLIK
jgi:glycosyltransferase involved in cell wall biosynthesis